VPDESEPGVSLLVHGRRRTAPFVLFYTRVAGRGSGAVGHSTHALAGGKDSASEQAVLVARLERFVHFRLEERRFVLQLKPLGSEQRHG
jgi:hypothetical protein